VAWFRNRPDGPGGGSYFPRDTLDWLAQVGRFEWDPQKYPMPEVRIDKMYNLAQADRARFLRELAALAVPAGGWAALGAKYVLLDVLPIDTDTPHFNAIAAAGYQFLRDHGVPPNRLSPNDRTLWQRVNTSSEPWLVWREPPPDRLVPLRPGELRKVSQVHRADGFVNDVLVRQDAVDKFTALIKGPYSETDTHLAQTEWHVAPTLHQLYIRVAESSQTPTDWASADLMPYFPLPPMAI
jgi:hypothetical protein